jgi:hypothetical protein
MILLHISHMYMRILRRYTIYKLRYARYWHAQLISSTFAIHLRPSTALFLSRLLSHSPSLLSPLPWATRKRVCFKYTLTHSHTHTHTHAHARAQTHTHTRTHTHTHNTRTHAHTRTHTQTLDEDNPFLEDQVSKVSHGVDGGSEEREMELARETHRILAHVLFRLRTWGVTTAFDRWATQVTLFAKQRKMFKCQTERLASEKRGTDAGQDLELEGEVVMPPPPPQNSPKPTLLSASFAFKC